MELSVTASRMAPSGIRAIMDLARKRPDTVHLEVGESDTPTPSHIIEAADRAARERQTRYAPNAGVPELREQIARHSTTHGVQLSADQIIVTNGGTQGIFLVMAALLDAGDEVLLPDPGWPNYAMMATLLGAVPVPYPLCADDGYATGLENIGPLVSARTRMLITNSPSNPLGTVIGPAAMRELAGFADARDLWLLADECYDGIVFDGEFPSARSTVRSPRLITAHSFSKTYSMTGLRVGYVAAPPRVASVLARIQEALVSSINTPAQHAAIAALRGPREPLRAMVDTYRHRRDVVMRTCHENGGAVVRPAGAFYVWTDVSGAGLPSDEFARLLLEREGIAVAPGNAFGDAGNGFVRVTLSAPENVLADAFTRMLALVRDGR